MSYYERHILQLRDEIYANQKQLDTVIGLRNYILENYEQDLNLDFLAEQFHTSKFHLLRMFKRYYGQSPHQFLIEKRIERAKSYLREGNTVSECCFAMGFSSLSSFSKLFKTKTGLSPSEFKKRNIRQAS